MTVTVAASPDALAFLPGAQFADAYRQPVTGPAISARLAAERMMTRSPPWVNRLMKLRNIIMAPFGVRVPGWTKAASPTQIGIFPVVAETPARVLAGFDDKHLDFRVVVDVSLDKTGQFVTATTVVRTHNALGRIYLTAIMPFHRPIVQHMLQQIIDLPHPA